MLFSQGCASGRLSMQSSPSEAEVFIRAVNETQGEPLGKTPIDLSEAELTRRMPKLKGPFIVEMKKLGYNDEKIYVTEWTAATDLRMNIKLAPFGEKQSDSSNQSALNRTIDLLFESQRLARVKRFEEALVLLQELQLLEPHLAAIYELQGGIFYLQKKYDKAPAPGPPKLSIITILLATFTFTVMA
ncbi:MAG: hypothetical protein SGJ18_11570 [Pseudomonadota bacterium]|nr:hypothetical protein [Pseudomonadota bacterium]